MSASASARSTDVVRSACLTLAVVCAAACATVPSPRAEQSLAARAAAEEAALAKRVKARDDPALAEYLAGIARRLQPDAGALRITVLEDPTLAAWAMPGGRIYVHTGLLSRLEDEAQLAVILARELGRVGPAAAREPARRAREPFPRTPLSPVAAAILGLDLRIAATSAISGHGADVERDADRDAVQRLRAAGYDAGAALGLFARLATTRDERGALEIFLYGSPPRMGERYESFRALLPAAGAPPSAVVGALSPSFRDRLRRVVRDNAALDIRAGRFTLARSELERVLAAGPPDAVAELYYGDLYRLRSQRAPAAERAEYLTQARARYERAQALDVAYAEPFRQLGLLYYQERDAARARGAFERYLALAPEAPDAPRIRGYLDAMEPARP